MLCSSLPLRGGVFLMTRPTVAYLLKKKYGLLNREVDMWSLDTLPPPPVNNILTQADAKIYTRLTKSSYNFNPWTPQYFFWGHKTNLIDNYLT